MKHVKSEKIKKLESELADLEQWLKLGLVPKKDVDKHKKEITAIKEKIEDEKERLLQLKESGETEEYVTPKRGAPRAAYAETPTIPDIDAGDTIVEGENDAEADTDVIDVENTIEEREEEKGEEEEGKGEEEEAEDESYFSDRNRWRRGGIVDPDANEW